MGTTIHNLPNLRGERNMTQQHLADAAEVSLRTVKRAESGIGISADAKAAILAALNVFNTAPAARPMIIAAERRVVCTIEVGRHSLDAWKALQQFFITESEEDFLARAMGFRV
jgi:transcriptional regulator with XRE-family HTH domain